MSNVLSFAIGQAFAGRGTAYVYVLYSKEQHVLYVGQTHQRGGPLQRLGQHLGNFGTFRYRIYDHDGIELEDITDLALIALPLPDDPAYRSESPTYREGVEYLLQKRIESDGVTWKPYFYLVSEVEAVTTTTLREIQEIADRFYNVVEALYQLP